MRPRPVFFILLVIGFLAASCATSRSSQGRRKYNRRCGECPSWSYHSIKPGETIHFYGKV